MATLGMAKEVRNKIVKIRLTPTENELAEKLALEERITVSDLMRSRTFKVAPMPNSTSSEFLKKTNRTILQLEKYLAENSQPEEISSLLQQVRTELIEARGLIASLSKRSPI